MIASLADRGRRARIAVEAWLWGRRMQKARMLLLGRHVNDGWMARIILYFLLAVIAYLYVQPLLYMISTSFKNLNDLLDPTVKWIPRELHLDNFKQAWFGLKYPQALANTLLIAVICSVAQVFICAMVGYALANLSFPGRGLITFLVMVTFLVPPQIIIIPLYIVYSKLGWLNTPFVFIIPALLGQGVRSALFIMIFRQFFRTQPVSLAEAAKLDGASELRLFFRIMLPLARSACLVVFLFSFIWYWNMYYEPSMFLQNQFIPLSISLDRLAEELTGLPKNYISFVGTDPVTEASKMAAASMIIFPPVILYIFLQRWFVEGLDRAGMVE